MKKINGFKFLLLAVLSLFASHDVFAQAKKCKMVRKYTSEIFGGKHFASADELCRAIESKFNSQSKEEKFTYIGFSSTCDYKVQGSSWRDSTYQRINSVDVEECEEENECNSKKDKKFVYTVPLGKVKITDLQKGTYDFKYKEPPKSLCADGCAMKLKGDFWGHSHIDTKNKDENGYHTFSGMVEYMGTGGKCVPNDASDGLQEPEKPKEDEKIDKDKCEGKGGYYGQVNGKDVCLGIDDKQNKCLPGQTYGKVNGKEVCLTPEGDQLPVPKPGDENKPGNGSGDGNGGGGNGNGGNGQGNGSGGGGGSGGGIGLGHGIGQGDGEGEGKDECSKNPDRLGCMKAGDPQDGKPLGKSDRSAKFDSQDVPLPVNGCPAPRNFSVSGMKFTVDLEPLCKAADIARPFVLLLANFSAVFIATLGIKRNKGL